MADFLKKKIFWVTLLLSLLFFIPIVFPVFTQNLFDNDLSSEDLTFSELGNLTRFLVISKFANVSSSSLNFSGKGAVIYDTWNFTPIYADGLDYNNSNFWTTLDGASPFIIKSLGNGSEVYSQSLIGRGCVAPDNPIDISKYGDSLYLLGSRRNLISRFNEEDGSYDNFCFNLTNLANSGGFSPVGIVYNGTNFWVLESLVGQDDKIHKYDSSGVFISSCNLSETGNPTGLYFNGTYFYLNDGGIVRRYYENCTYTDWFFNLTTDTNPKGITFNGTDFWISYSNPPIVYRYNSLNFPNDPYLEVGNPNGVFEWNFDGIFNHSQNKTLDFSVVLNSALNSGECDCNNCSLVNSDLNCSIPFLFHSGTSGVIGYSDINITFTHRPRIYTNVSLPSSVDQNENVVLQVNVTDPDGEAVSFCNFTAVSPSNVYVINNENGTHQNISGNFIYNSSEIQANETGLYTWNATCGDLSRLTSIATGLFSANDTQFPSPFIDNPTNTTYTNSSVPFDKSWVDDVGVKECWYSLNLGVSNTTVSCTDNITLSLTNNDYTLIFWVKDYANKENSTNVTFAVDVPAAVVTVVEGGGGGAPPPLTNFSWSMTNDRGGDFYVFSMLAGDTRRASILLSNQEESNISVKLTCAGSICDLVDLESEVTTLSVSKTAFSEVFFRVNVPQGFEDGSYSFNLVGTEPSGGKRSITVDVVVGGLSPSGFFFNKVTGSTIVDFGLVGGGLSEIPNLGIAFFVSVLMFLGGFYVAFAGLTNRFAWSLLISLIVSFVVIVIL